jgi:adenine-specific DNA-methyltransferase
MSDKKIEKLLQKVERLERENKKLRQNKSYGLVWDVEREPEQVVVDCEKKLPVLKDVKSKRIEAGKGGPMNILIEGDNYHALQVLNYTHKGKIDVIYIDPPYNTGDKNWKYNNKFVNSDDLFKHSKYLNFIYNRLKLSKELLKNNGIICVTNDDNEMHRVWSLMDQIFGEENHLGTVVIRINPGGKKSKRKVATQHEYAIFFAKSKSTKIAQLEIDPSQKSHNYKKDKNGEWYEERNLRKEGQDSLAKAGANRYYPIYYDKKSGGISTTKKFSEIIWPLDSNGKKRIWRRDKKVIDEMFKKGELEFKETRFGKQIYFKFRGGTKGETPKSLWLDKKFSASEHGTQVLDAILGKREAFPFPKSPHAVIDCIKAASSNKESIVLDFFAGSGTTGHAILELNKQDGGNRKFILCTNNEDNNNSGFGVAEGICFPRVKNIIRGYKNLKGEKVAGLGGNLAYFRTGFVDVDGLSAINDEKRLKLTFEAGEIIALKEDVFDEKEKNKYYQIFEGMDKIVGIYFLEDHEKLDKLIDKLNKSKVNNKVLYLFSWGKNEYLSENFGENIKVKDIPEPIIQVYKKINSI